MFGYDNVKTAKRLKLGAWIIEIIAAAVGIFMALSRIFETPTGEDVNIISVLQGALPFFAVAMIELTKIPLAYVFYSAQTIRWRVVFLTALAFTMLITFETFFVGFESYQAVITKKLRPLINEITKEQQIVADANDQMEVLISGAPQHQNDRAEYSRTQNEITDRYDEQINTLLRKQTDIKEKYAADTKPILAKIERLEIEIKKLESDFDAQKSLLLDERKEARLHSQKVKQDNDKILRSEISKLEDKITLLGEQRRADIKEAQLRYDEKIKAGQCFLFCSQYAKDLENRKVEINSNYEKLVNNIQANIEQKSGLLNSTNLKSTAAEHNLELKELSKRFEKNRAELELERDQLDDQLAAASKAEYSPSDLALLRHLDGEITKFRDQKNDELSIEKKRFDQTRQLKENQKQRGEEAELRKIDASKKLVFLCAQLNDKVVDNQVYRLAMQLFDVRDACSLKEEHLSTTKTIWFGSLALIVSALGTILALASFVTHDGTNKSNIRKKSLINFLRMILLAILRSKRVTKTEFKEVVIEKIVEVTKEIPVEKVVFRDVPVEKKVVVEKIVEVTKEIPVDKVVFRDVPVEIVRKEIVHVPVHVDNTALVGKNFEIGKAYA